MDAMFRAFENPLMTVLLVMAVVVAMFTALLFSAASRDKRLIARLTKIERGLNGLLSAYKGKDDVNGNDHLRDEFVLSLRGMGDSITRLAADITQSQQSQLDMIAEHLKSFSAIAPEKLSADVWEMLDSAYGEITQFAGALARTQKKLRQATESIEDAARKSRVIEKRMISAPRFHKAIKKTE